MPLYVVTARAAQGKRKFSDEVGPSQFLEVPDGSAVFTPAMAIKRDDWVRKVMDLCGRTKDATNVVRGDVLVFVHGYNNSIEIVLARHRRLLQDLPQHGYTGTVVSFDWPSADLPLAYVADREKAKLTALRLVDDCIELFARLQSTAECEVNVHVLAHSTGAYVVREAFDEADDRSAVANINWTVSQLALIAADISSASMSRSTATTDALYRHCQRLTNYSNPFDEALQIANVKRLGVAPRLGRVGLPEDAPDKAVGVDCGAYYTSMIATRPAAEIIGYPSHSWYIGDPVFTEDLALTLKGDLDRSVLPTRTEVTRNRYLLKAPEISTAAATAAAD